MQTIAYAARFDTDVTIRRRPLTALIPRGPRSRRISSVQPGAIDLVLDSAPEELVQVVGYLQSVTEKIDIDLVTVTAYNAGGSQVLVPQRVEPGRRVRELSDPQADARQSGTLSPGSAEFRAAIAAAPASLRDTLAKPADWGDALEREGLVKLASFRGRQGITTLLPRLAADNAGLVSIAIDNRTAYMQFWRSAFERRAPQSITAVQAALGAELRQGNATHNFPSHCSQPSRAPTGKLPAIGCSRPRPSNDVRDRHVSARQFRDDDQGYLAWTAAHRRGYVIAPQRDLDRPYIKICSASVREIQDWARANLSRAIPRRGAYDPLS